MRAIHIDAVNREVKEVALPTGEAEHLKELQRLVGGWIEAGVLRLRHLVAVSHY